jgi:hypothetical protein
MATTSSPISSNKDPTGRVRHTFISHRKADASTSVCIPSHTHTHTHTHTHQGGHSEMHEIRTTISCSLRIKHHLTLHEMFISLSVHPGSKFSVER